MNDCPICARGTIEGSEYCEYHTDALKNIKEAYPSWKNAMGITWEEYIDLLIDEENAGKWVREVAEYLMQ